MLSVLHKRRDQSHTLLLLDLTSHPTLPNVSAPHLSAPAAINKELADLTHPWDTGCLVNIVSDVTSPSRGGCDDEAAAKACAIISVAPGSSK